MRVLVTGAAGLLGGRIALALRSRHEVVAAVHSAAPPAGLKTVPLDLLAPDRFPALLESVRPEAVVHAAARADLDQCEQDPDAAFRINTDATAAVADACAARGTRLAFLSTDQVFGDRSPWGPRTEAAEPVPLSVYGRSKAAAEGAVRAHPGHAVFRVALVSGRGHGPRGSCTESLAWALAASRPLRLFSDQYRTPVDADSVAEAVLAFLSSHEDGLFHLGGPERVSRSELGLRVAEALELDPRVITSVSQDEAPSIAPRPHDVSLDSSRAASKLGFRSRSLDDSIQRGRRLPASA